MSGQLISLRQLLSSLSGKQLMSSMFVGASSKQLFTERRLEADMLRTLDRQSVYRVVVHLKHFVTLSTSWRFERYKPYQRLRRKVG